MTKSLTGRIDDLEKGTTKKRTVFIFQDDFFNDTVKYWMGKKSITRAEFEALENDPSVDVVRFVWVSEPTPDWGHDDD